nr:immunoglobulin light chain junction region [Macaca mulatta]
CMHALDFPLTF